MFPHLSAPPGLCPEALGPQSRLVPHPLTCPLASLCFSAPLTPLAQIFCAARWDWEPTTAKLLITSSPFTVMLAPTPDFRLKTLVPHQPQAACFRQHTCLCRDGRGDPCSVVIASTPPLFLLSIRTLKLPTRQSQPLLLLGAVITRLLVSPPSPSGTEHQPAGSHPCLTAGATRSPVTTLTTPETPSCPLVHCVPVSKHLPAFHPLAAFTLHTLSNCAGAS